MIQLPTTRTATRIHGRFSQITNAATMATATKDGSDGTDKIQGA